MFSQENEYKSLLPKNAHGSPSFDKVACTKIGLHSAEFFAQNWYTGIDAPLVLNRVNSVLNRSYPPIK